MNRLLALFIFTAAIASAQPPADRPLTDPKSINSAASSTAAAVPIDQLFYTRSTSAVS
jgi:hypothetical protein